MGLKGAHRDAMLKMPPERKLELLKQQSGEVRLYLLYLEFITNVYLIRKRRTQHTG